ncbi:hypothetical protein SKAU_G00154640 [Synaphobranchus kaupii]|uniref:Uncharacterized protein n=1 Tax=Synaphobranchus kaupii TaxID=118154 RepID=A0A9Q1FHB9_SYNKA|nr:hypothetical protein SKAU_G00154640 [Synaphobranchus kaupii]
MSLLAQLTCRSGGGLCTTLRDSKPQPVLIRFGLCLGSPPWPPSFQKDPALVWPCCIEWALTYGRWIFPLLHCNTKLVTWSSPHLLQSGKVTAVTEECTLHQSLPHLKPTVWTDGRTDRHGHCLIDGRAHASTVPVSSE